VSDFSRYGVVCDHKLGHLIYKIDRNFSRFGVGVLCDLGVLMRKKKAALFGFFFFLLYYIYILYIYIYIYNATKPFIFNEEKEECPFCFFDLYMIYQSTRIFSFPSKSLSCAFQGL
jgi:hypothetical protein